MAEHLYTYDNPPSERDLTRACKVLEDGGVIAYCTDFNWAFGCEASNSKGLDRIRLLKPSHPKDRPFSLICSSISMASTVANIDQPAFRLLRKMWPGPYTVILPRNRNLPKQLKDKRKVVGVRIPSNNMVRELVEKLGRPIATTSVPELSQGLTPQFGYQVFEAFGHGLDLILDLGTEVPGVESTVVDLSEGGLEIIREGAGPIDIIEN